MTVNAVDLIIGSHNAVHTGITASLHGGKMDLPEFLLADSRCAGINSAGGLALAAEMLGHATHALGLHAGDGRRCHPGGKIGILGIALLASSPSRVPEHIESRHERQLHMTGFQLTAAGLVAFL